MEKKGYLAIDSELGGENFGTGKDSILEIGLLAFPDPAKSGMQMNDFISKYIVQENVKHFIIKPYANIDPEILKKVLKKPLEYYQNNGDYLSDVSGKVVSYIKELRHEYGVIAPLSDWYGDVVALDFIVSKNGETKNNLLGHHNMFHLN